MARHVPALVAFALAAATTACHVGPVGSPAPASGSRYVFLWAGDADKRESDFLAVVDADPRSAGYGAVVATLPVGVAGTRPHHPEYAMPAGGVLWANGFDASKTFAFDVHRPDHPALARTFGDPAPFGHPHSYARLPNGHVLATFQWEIVGGRHDTGGLVELDADGAVVRSARAAVPSVDPAVRPYSLAVLPALDRVVTTATDMHLDARSSAIQVWRLSDLTLLQTILLPPGRRGDEQWLTAEPRVLADGHTVLVNTFTCGLYRVDGLDGPTATPQWVYSSAWNGRSEGKSLDGATGSLRLDAAFTTPGATLPGVDFARQTWPHGTSGRAIPHGAVFSRP